MMGVCQSSEVRRQFAKNKDIEKELREEKQAQLIKLLLLGAGECGKSTILKQMQILHANGFTEEEINERKGVVYSNTTTSLASILRALTLLEISLDDAEREQDMRVIFRVIEVGDDKEPFTEEVFNALKSLWSDKGIQECYERRSEYQLNDSAKYFLDSVDRVKQAGFKPTEKDILYTRVATTGVVEVKFVIKNIDFRVFDVGGQRSERRKWIHCFDNVNAIIYISAISEYDQMLFEDDTVNRLTESMGLFSSICNSAYFVNTSMILFLNKKDLFEEKLKKVSIKVLFSDFDGPQTYDESIEFIKQKFNLLNETPDTKTIYTHETCATDTNQVQIVLDSVLDIIIQKNLQNVGME